jgi:hypothetical protein
MNSTNNEIYKIAKYLDKYTKESNKEGGVYLQKLDNYLHKVQRGGNGEVVQLAQEIGNMVEEVVRVHKQAKSELQKSLDGVEGDSVEKQYNEKVRALQEQITELEKTIKQKKEQSARAASASPSPKAASAAPAPKVLTFETLTSDRFYELTSDELYDLVCQKAKIDSTTSLKTAFTNKIKDTTNFVSVWTFKILLDELYNEPYFKKDDHVVDLMKIILVLLQLRAKFSAGHAPSEIEDISTYLQKIPNKEIFNSYIRDKLYLKDDYTFTYLDFQTYLRQQFVSPALASPALASPVRASSPIASSAAALAPAPAPVRAALESSALAASPIASSVPVPAPASPKEVITEQQQISKEAQKEKIQKEAIKLVSKKQTEYDSLESDKFYVMGYIVNPETGKVFGHLTSGTYKFPGEQETVGKVSTHTIILLKSLLRQPIIDALKITDQIKSDSSFNLSDNTILKISLQKPVNIREFVNKINNIETVVKLSNESGETNYVRLFVKPLTYKMREGITENEIKINEFAEIISKAILSLVANTQSTQVQQSPRDSATGASGRQPFRNASIGIGDRGSRRGIGFGGGSMSSRGPYRHPSLQPPTPSASTS